jgi:hypothetical protein
LNDRLQAQVADLVAASEHARDDVVGDGRVVQIVDGSP